MNGTLELSIVTLSLPKSTAIKGRSIYKGEDCTDYLKTIKNERIPASNFGYLVRKSVMSDILVWKLRPVLTKMGYISKPPFACQEELWSNMQDEQNTAKHLVKTFIKTDSQQEKYHEE